MFEFDWSLQLMVLCVFCDSSPADTGKMIDLQMAV